jgi:hypothetical protein
MTRFAIAFGALTLLLATRLLSHTTGPNVANLLVILLVSGLFAAPPVAIWYALDRRRARRG